MVIALEADVKAQGEEDEDYKNDQEQAKDDDYVHVS